VFHHIADRWAAAPGDALSQGGLVVLIQSFSYRDGYPPDVEGHGGGFVFDCRALPNPHHVPALRDLTGEAPEIAAFLEPSPEVQAFWENARGLVEAQIDTYADRGFTSLTVSFGCTGGRHRSVFLASKLAAHLARHRPQVTLRVRHTAL
jgi:RNase adaptor protein for sRNA GlmZ degradation